MIPADSVSRQWNFQLASSMTLLIVSLDGLTPAPGEAIYGSAKAANISLTQTLAIELGTYPISIIPDQDCCTLFTPRNPLTRARLARIEAAEAALPVDDLVARALGEAVVEDFEFPVVGSRIVRS